MAVAALAASCRQEMHDQARYKELAASTFFADGRSARPPVPGTVARGQFRGDDHLHTGREGKDLSARFPFPIDMQVLERGRERYDIFCSPCHDRTGGGLGIIVRRGYRRPMSFMSEDVRRKPAGHYFDVITRGFGAMPDHAAQIPVRDRWAIAAYIRVLQRAQDARREDVPPEEMQRLMGGGR